jgi:hypothetical protein
MYLALSFESLSKVTHFSHCLVFLTKVVLSTNSIGHIALQSDQTNFEVIL